jgi:signal transduction histidine kinase/ActR/RegA family two-component response regulator
MRAHPSLPLELHRMPIEPRSGSNVSPSAARVLILPPTTADGLAMSKLFRAHDIPFALCPDMAALTEHRSDAAMFIVSEEALGTDGAELPSYIAQQPVWSDLPIIVLSRSGRESTSLAQILPQLGNASVLERPVRISTLLSLVRSHLRARERQYQLRDYLIEREQLLGSERAARSQSEQLSRTKDEFLATLGHELRTPLNAMLGWTQVLRRLAGLPAEAAKAAEVIERNARSQAQIIDDLLDMSRIISGKVRLNIQRIDLIALIEATLETVRPAAEAKRVQLHAMLEPAAGPVHGDPNRLQQVLWNLLTNAVKFTPPEGHITVSLARVDSHVEVQVVDSGEGIDSTFLPHIFDRFRQADASTRRRHGGLGLGLSIARQIVELHGGTVTGNSAGRGAGATFRVMLPIIAVTSDFNDAQNGAERPARSPQFTDATKSAQTDLTGIKVLVVDDEADARALIERVLTEGNARVITAASVEEALRVLAEHVPDILISDIGMPGEDGYTLIRRLRSGNDPVALIPAIALTAYARHEDRLRAGEAGFQLHLSKPLEATELVAAIRALAKPPATVSNSAPVVPPEHERH